MLNLLYGISVIVSLIFVYGVLNDRKLHQRPSEAEVLSPIRFTPQRVLAAAKALSEEPIVIDHFLPPKTGRRYIVVGGAGFLGGWIVLQLLQRGEDPKRIRIIDMRPPVRPDLRTGLAQQVALIQVDISDEAAVSKAFKAPWPDASTTESEPEITVFHTAANIRFYERVLALLPRSTKVNHLGTLNIINCSKEIGTTTLIYTSSASVSVRRSRFWLWPWEKQPQFFVQVLDDDDKHLPKHHHDFFSNYAASKAAAEMAVRTADKSRSDQSRTLRTGCIRPGNGVFGPGGTPSASITYVENCALAHLCYEQRLIELGRGSSNPDIGGQAFTVTDPGPPVTYGDIYTALCTLDKEIVFPALSTSLMLGIAHMIEAIYVTKAFLSTSDSFLGRTVFNLIPTISGDVINLQPSLFALISVHVIFDDSRARLSPGQGGLGYNGPYTTLQGLCKTAEEHHKSEKYGEEHARNGGGVSFGFSLRTRVGVKKVQKKVSEQLHVEAVNTPN
ncbi:hypothetical protein BU15DRAFT_89438 [Melanogaster broomeanus]|nr:hypothetical protein BU15DRAFT_89438 [Melanogaster broomeanus]